MQAKETSNILEISHLLRLKLYEGYFKVKEQKPLQIIFIKKINICEIMF